MGWAGMSSQQVAAQGCQYHTCCLLSRPVPRSHSTPPYPVSLTVSLATLSSTSCCADLTCTAPFALGCPPLLPWWLPPAPSLFFGRYLQVTYHPSHSLWGTPQKELNRQSSQRWRQLHGISITPQRALWQPHQASAFVPSLSSYPAASHLAGTWSSGRARRRRSRVLACRDLRFSENVLLNSPASCACMGVHN